jgi:hypothetical protein
MGGRFLLAWWCEFYESFVADPGAATFYVVRPEKQIANEQ